MTLLREPIKCKADDALLSCRQVRCYNTGNRFNPKLFAGLHALDTIENILAFVDQDGVHKAETTDGMHQGANMCRIALTDVALGRNQLVRRQIHKFQLGRDIVPQSTSACVR